MSRAGAFIALVVAGCGPVADKPERPRFLPGHTTFEVEGDTTPAFPDDFTPPPPLAEPLPGSPLAFGAQYLEALSAQLSLPWATFLEDLRTRLPPSHPLNDRALSALVAFQVDTDGRPRDIAISRSSALAVYDDAVLEMFADVVSFPPPPTDVVGDDGVARVEWLFARNFRQAGVATARMAPARFSADRAVPLLLGRGEFALAAARIAAAEGLDAEIAAALLDDVAHRIVVAAAVEGDAAAIVSLSPKDVPSIAGELRKIAATRGSLGAVAALEALSKAGDAEVAAIASAIIRAPSSPEALVVAAARSWARAESGAAETISAGVEELLLAVGPTERRRAFLIASAVPIRAIARAAETQLDSDDGVLAAAALARLAQAGDKGAATLIGEELEASVALRRVRAAQSLADLDGALPKPLRNAPRRALRDADERVRAAAVVMIAKQSAGRVATLTSALAGESSPAVLVTLARALAADSSVPSTRRLKKLLASDDAIVRAVAARAMWGRPKVAETLEALVSDPDERVSRAALPGRPARELERLVEASGSLALDALSAMLSLDTASRPAAVLCGSADSATRVAASIAWLAARKRATLSG